MKARLFVLFAAVALGATSVQAQTGVDTKRCPPGTANGFGVPDQTRASQDACQKAIDLFQYWRYFVHGQIYDPVSFQLLRASRLIK